MTDDVNPAALSDDETAALPNDDIAVTEELDGRLLPGGGADDSDAVSRRTFVAKAAVGIAGAGTIAAACGPTGDGGTDGVGAPAVQTGQRVLWRMASSYPRSIDTIFGASELFAEEVSNLTNGRFEIRVYPANELVPALQVLDSVQQGVVQCGHSPSYYYVGKSQALAFDTAVPFGLTSRQQSAWLFEGGGLELMRRVFADFNIINFPMGNTGAQMGGWFRREVHTAADLSGLKMRIPGLGGQVMDRLGVAVQNIQAGEIYSALERGAIDATEWVGPYDDEKLGLHRAAPYYYYPGWWEPGAGTTVQVNMDAWNDLASDYQAAIRVASRMAHGVMQTSYDGRNPAALKRLIAGGTELRRFSAEIMRVSAAASEALMEDNANADPVYREVYDQWRQFRADTFQWFATTEFAYADDVYGSRSG